MFVYFFLPYMVNEDEYIDRGAFDHVLSRYVIVFNTSNI